MDATGTHVAYIGLGSNLGMRDRNVTTALNFLAATRGVHVVKVSSLYETSAVGGPTGQSQYINCAARLDTELSAERLIALFLNVEKRLGRKRSEEVHWGPRTIDIDLLFYDDAVFAEEWLTVPHPLMHERRFVLEPLNEIAPTMMHPMMAKTVSEMLAELGGA